MVWGGSTMNSVTHLHHESIASRRGVIRPYQLGPGAAKEPYPCMNLCGECGYLCATEPPCPSCGQKAWIDLGYTAYAEVLRALEAEARRHPPAGLTWRIRLASLSTGGAIGLGGAAGLALSGLAFGAPLAVLLGAGAVALTHAVGRHRFARAIMAERVLRPTRWHVPLPLARPDARPASRTTGAILPNGPLLRAPFTGRACAAYDVGVMFDAPGDAWPPIWVLREMHSCALEVEGRTVPADAANLALPLAPVPEPALTADEKTRFLRERGLFAADGEFDLFEAIVAPGQPCELLWPSAPDGAPPVLRATAAPRARDPYR